MGGFVVRTPVLVALLATLLAGVAAAAEGPGPVALGVSRQAAEAVAARLQAGGAAPVPRGWTLERSDCDRAGFTIVFHVPPSRVLGLKLSLPPGEGARGRWFAHEAFAEGAALAPGEREVLMAIARDVDAALDEDPWIRSAGRGGRAAGPASDGRAGLRPVGRGAWNVLLLALLASCAFLTRPGARAWAWLGRVAGRATPLLLGCIVLGAAAVWLPHLDLPFEEDAMTQRVFFGSLDLSDILRHRYDDERHPPLFYAVLHFVPGALRHEAAARLPAMAFGLLTLVSSYLFARRIVDAPRALLIPLLLAVFAPLALHARDVSNVTLLLALTLLSSTLLLAALERPRPSTLVGLAVVEVALLYCNYAALLVAGGQLVVLGAFARRRPLAWLWGGAGGVVVSAFPELVRLATAVRHDQPMRALSARFAGHLWGDRHAGEFAREALGLFFPSGWPGALALAVAAVGAVRLVRARGRSPAVLLLAVLVVEALVTIALGVSRVRLKPYYLSYLAPLACVLVVVGACGVGAPAVEAPRRRFGRLRSALGAFALLGCLGLYGVDLAREMPHRYRGSELGQIRSLAQVVRAEGPPLRVAADPHAMHTLLLYYLFPDPAALYRGCGPVGPEGLTCAEGGRELVTLTGMPFLSEGWEQRSVSRLLPLLTRPLWFVYSERFENRPLLATLEARCASAGAFGPFLLFRCGPR